MPDAPPDAPRPRLRPIEAIPVDDQRIALRDPAGYSQEVLAVSRPLAWLLQFLDGRNTIEEICRRAREATGQDLPATELEGVVRVLENAGFLDGPTFRERRRRIEEEFRSQDVRAMFHAGRSYPADPGEFRRFARDYVGETPSPPPAGPPPLAAVAPHIELSLGRDVYAALYRRLAGSPKPGRVVILATSHLGLEHVYALTRKPYATPLGTLPGDPALVDRLVREAGPGVLQDEARHRTEHTAEFQAVLLHALWPDDPPRVVPVLCGYGAGDLHGERERAVVRFADALAQGIDDGVPTMLLASVDFAHVGPRYGDPRGPAPEEMERLASHERRMTDFLAARDADGFHRLILQTQDGTRVCGFPALHTMLRALPAGRGEPLAYGHAKMDDRGSLVTFGSMLYR